MSSQHLLSLLLLMTSLLLLPDSGRAMGIHVMASKGAGKSRLMGRVIGFVDFLRRVPQVVIDPHGPVIDNLLDKITRCTPEQQGKLWPRLRYVEMSGRHGSVTAFPLYYRLGSESLATIASRYPDAVIRLNPELNRAPVAGANAIRRIGVPTGMLLFSLGLQITSAPDVLAHPEPYLARAAGKPDVVPALRFFQHEYLPLSVREREQLTGSFLRKVAMFQYDSAMQAMFATSEGGLNWQEVVDKRLTVFIDLRHLHERERIQFTMYWVLESLLEWIKVRGAGRHVPLSLIVDELTYLVQGTDTFSELMGTYLQEVIERIARNYSIWLTLAHQELHQFPPALQETLMTMGTQLIGSTTNLTTATLLAQRYYPFDPYLVKDVHPVYHVAQGIKEVIDERMVYFSREEQVYLAAKRFLDLPRFTFLSAIAQEEGSMPTNLTRLSIQRIDSGQYVNQSLCETARAQLATRDGQPIARLLAETTQKQHAILRPRTGEQDAPDHVTPEDAPIGPPILKRRAAPRH